MPQMTQSNELFIVSVIKRAGNKQQTAANRRHRQLTSHPMPSIPAKWERESEDLVWLWVSSQTRHFTGNPKFYPSRAGPLTDTP